MSQPKMTKTKAFKLRGECAALLAEALVRGLYQYAESQKKRLDKLDELIARYPEEPKPEPVADAPTLVINDGGPK